MNDEMELPSFYEVDSLSTEVYDALVESIAQDGDTDFYRRLARETGGPVLEVGCGTGRVAIALAADGREVVGVDRSGPMLELAEHKRASLDAAVAARLSFIEADMTTIDLGRDFALIITPSRVFQFALTSQEQLQALGALRLHLDPEGKLVLDLFDPLLDRVVPTDDPPARGGELIHPKTGNRVSWAVIGRSPEPGRQIIVEYWKYQELDRSGSVLRSYTERLTLRWSTRSEMRLLFELAGLEIVGEYGGFFGGPPDYGEEQVWVLQPRKA